jgi:hypothetical protein
VKEQQFNWANVRRATLSDQYWARSAVGIPDYAVCQLADVGRGYVTASTEENGIDGVIEQILSADLMYRSEATK